MTLEAGSQNPTCPYCGVRLIFRSQTSCHSCGRSLVAQAEPLAPAGTASPAALAPATPLAPAKHLAAPSTQADATPIYAPEPDAAAGRAESQSVLRYFESSRLPPQVPLPGATSIADTSPPVAAPLPSSRETLPAYSPRQTSRTEMPERHDSNPHDSAGPATIDSPPQARGGQQRPHGQHATNSRHDQRARGPQGSTPPQQPATPAWPARLAPDDSQEPTGRTWDSDSRSWSTPYQTGRRPYRTPARSDGSASLIGVVIFVVIALIIGASWLANAQQQHQDTPYYPFDTSDPGYVFPYETPVAVDTPAPLDSVGQTGAPVDSVVPEVGATAADTVAPVETPAPDSSYPYLNFSRMGHTATLLADGTVLIAGGLSGQALSSVELFVPSEGGFKNLAPMSVRRAHFTATRLNDGRVLLAGGEDELQNTLSSAEIWDPTTGRSQLVGPMKVARSHQVATLLADGKVLITGGFDGKGPIGSVEIFDPVTGKFALTGAMLQPRYDHAAVRLRDGSVLIVGGTADGPLASAETFTPKTGAFAATGDMSEARSAPTAILLKSGQVLVAGTSGAASLTVDLWSPDGGRFQPGPRMNNARSSATIVGLSDGRVMIAGGVDETGRYWVGTAEIYDPSHGTDVERSLEHMLVHATGTLLNDGSVLVCGGGHWYDSSWAEVVRP